MAVAAPARRTAPAPRTLADDGAAETAQTRPSRRSRRAGARPPRPPRSGPQAGDEAAPAARPKLAVVAGRTAVAVRQLPDSAWSCG